ncbi:hypothetical protein, no similarity [Maudiozyma saulgeensis]|uniref:Uncharacterized protein n=1 Tax=Maudiozyma saulgeensis TaxID=1789683 RepID=A0A1X7R4W5_9SACH|nr:hypothetical protein, no similarity [Kazachstania saulgeensis]
MSENSFSRLSIPREMRKIIDAANTTDGELRENPSLMRRINLERKLREESRWEVPMQRNIKDHLYHNVPMYLLNRTVGEYSDMAYFFNKLYNVHGVGSAFNQPPLYENHEIVTSGFINDIYSGRLSPEDAQKKLSSYSAVPKQQELNRIPTQPEIMDAVGKKLERPLKNFDTLDASVIRSEMTIQEDHPSTLSTDHIEPNIKSLRDQSSERKGELDMNAPSPLVQNVMKEYTTKFSTITKAVQDEPKQKVTSKPIKPITKYMHDGPKENITLKTAQSNTPGLNMDHSQDVQKENSSKAANHASTVTMDSPSTDPVPKEMVGLQNMNPTLPNCQSEENPSEALVQNTDITTTENVKTTEDGQIKFQPSKFQIPITQNHINATKNEIETNKMENNGIPTMDEKISTITEKDNRVETNSTMNPPEVSLKSMITDRISATGDTPQTKNLPTEDITQDIIIPQTDSYSTYGNKDKSKTSNDKTKIIPNTESIQIPQRDSQSRYISLANNIQLREKPLKPSSQQNENDVDAKTKTKANNSLTRVPPENAVLIDTKDRIIPLKTTYNIQQSPENQSAIKNEIINPDIGTENTTIITPRQTEIENANATKMDILKGKTLVAHNSISPQNNWVEGSSIQETAALESAKNNSNNYSIPSNDSKTANSKTISVGTDLVTVDVTLPEISEKEERKRKAVDIIGKVPKKRKESTTSDKEVDNINITTQQDNVLNSIKSSTFTIQSLLGNIHEDSRVDESNQEEEYDMDLAQSPDHFPMSSPPASPRDDLSENEDYIINKSDTVDILGHNEEDRDTNDDSDSPSNHNDNENERLPKALKRMNELAKKYGLYE